jgi:hypothetical protein
MQTEGHARRHRQAPPGRARPRPPRCAQRQHGCCRSGRGAAARPLPPPAPGHPASRQHQHRAAAASHVQDVLVAPQAQVVQQLRPDRACRDRRNTGSSPPTPRPRPVVRGNRRWRPPASPGHLSGCRDRRAGRRPARAAARGPAARDQASASLPRCGSPRWLPPPRPADSARPWAVPRSDASSAKPADRSWPPTAPGGCLRRIGLPSQDLQYCRSTILAWRRP